MGLCTKSPATGGHPSIQPLRRCGLLRVSRNCLLKTATEPLGVAMNPASRHSRNLQAGIHSACGGCPPKDCGHDGLAGGSWAGAALFLAASRSAPAGSFCAKPHKVGAQRANLGLWCITPSAYHRQRRTVKRISLGRHSVMHAGLVGLPVPRAPATAEGRRAGRWESGAVDRRRCDGERRQVPTQVLVIVFGEEGRERDFDAELVAVGISGLSAAALVCGGSEDDAELFHGRIRIAANSVALSGTGSSFRSASTRGVRPNLSYLQMRKRLCVSSCAHPFRQVRVC